MWGICIGQYLSICANTMTAKTLCHYLYGPVSVAGSQENGNASHNDELMEDSSPGC